MDCGGGNGCKQILTDLDAHHGISYRTESFAANEQSCAGEGDRSTFRCRGEPAAFIGITVVGKVGLGRKHLQLTAGNNGCAVKNLHAAADRQTHHRSQLRMGSRAFQNFLKTCFHSIMECILIKQVAAGVAGHGKLRKQQNIHILCVCFFQKVTNIPGILFNICHLYLRYGAGNTNIIQHGSPSITLIFFIIPHNIQFAKKI